jgi:hypothetical protein
MNRLAPFALAFALVSCETPLRSAAATAQVAPRLPNTMLGGLWCFTRILRFENDSDPNVTLLLRDKNFENCANRGGVRFWRRGGKSGFQLGRFEAREDCKISKIERIASKGSSVYRVHSYCRDEEATRFLLFELWQSKWQSIEGLRWRELEDDSK